VVFLAATGARFSQIARMTVGDVQAAQGRLMIPQSFKGRKRVLAPVVEAARSRRRCWSIGGTDRQGPCSGSGWIALGFLLGNAQTVSAGGRRGGVALVDPYALRHSSIVRGLRAGLPIRLVAALHDTSVAMIERHYSRYITEGLDELVARAVVPIVAKAA
jgi:integrase